MRKNLMLNSWRSALFLTVFGLLAAPALAQDQPTASAQTPRLVAFHPAASWKIGPSDLQYKDNKPRCALSGFYDNGFVMQMDAQNGVVDTININFRQPVFQGGKVYDAAVAVPGQKGTTFKARAASPALLSIDVRKDADLLPTLQGAGAFDLFIAQSAFRFYLTGVRDATARLKECGKGDVPISDAAKAAMAAPPALPPPTVQTAAMSTLPPSPPTASVLKPAVASMPAPAAPLPPAVKAEEKPWMKVNKSVAHGELDITDEGPTAPSAVEGQRIGELAGKISDLEASLRKLRKENESLKDELQTTLAEGKTEHTTISGENWNLERATMRFQEAERQLTALGQKLQRERASCDAEKKQLEGMLFDPQVTNEQQMARLADLEDQLAKAQVEMENQRLMYEERIRILEGHAAQ